MSKYQAILILVVLALLASACTELAGEIRQRSSVDGLKIAPAQDPVTEVSPISPTANENSGVPESSKNSGIIIVLGENSADASQVPETLELPEAQEVLEGPTLPEISEAPEIISEAAEVIAAVETPEPSVVNYKANLRGGPGTNYQIIGVAEQGDLVTPVGQSGDGSWYRLPSGTWIAAFLVDSAPDNLPVVGISQ